MVKIGKKIEISSIHFNLNDTVTFVWGEVGEDPVNVSTLIQERSKVYIDVLKNLIKEDLKRNEE